MPGFTRHYNSQLNKDLGLGVGWTASFSKRLELYSTRVQIRQVTGRGEAFSCPETTGACTGDADTELLLSKDTSGYILSYPEGTSERYDTAGLLISETDPQGRTVSYGYNGSSQLASVTGPYGHTLGLAWNGDHLASITDPAGQVYAYTYDANTNLIQVTHPDGSAKLYHYENASFPNHLTGISYQETSGTIQRYATYAYDSSGMAVLTEHAGGVERYTLQYDSASQTTVRDAADTAEVLTFSDQREITRGWNFNGTADGWTATNASLTPSADRVTLTATAMDPMLSRNVSSLVGRRHRYVTARIRQTAPGAWEGTLYYGTSAHGYSASFQKTIPAPAGLSVGGGWVNAVWDMHNLTAGGPDWKNSAITRIRLDFSYASGAAFEIDWIGYGSTYPDKNLVSKVNQADGKSLEQTFDANNNLTCKKDEEGRVTTYTYNGTNQKLSMTEGLAGDCTNPVPAPETRTISYQYLSPTLDLPAVISSPSILAGQTRATTITYGDSLHPYLPTLITQSGYTAGGAPVSRSASLAYNSFGQVISIDGPRTDVSDVTTLAYYECTTGGACGQLQSVANALGQTTIYDSYDAAGRVTQTSDPNGLITTYTYDARGRMITVVQTPPAGSARTMSYTYNAAGHVTSVTFPDGASLSYTYNAAQQLIRVTDNLGNYIAYTYDLKGNRTGESTYDPGGTLVRDVTTAYDLRNHVSTINAGGSLTQTVYDAIGNLVSETDPNNNPPASHDYDALNRLIQTIDALGGTTSYAYTPTDEIAEVATPNNATTQYLYDDLGNLLQETSPDRGTTTYTYDAAGNVLSKTDARGITAIYTYDALNRLSAIDYPGTAEDVAYTYDTGAICSSGIGRLCQVTDAAGATQYGYDAFANVIEQQKTELGIIYTTRYAYDARDRVLGIIYLDGRTVAYTRDALGRIQSVTATVNAVNQAIVSARTYRADGLLLSQTYGNGLGEARTYNLKGELTYQSLGSADTRLYGYDPNGNLTSLQSLPQVADYTYDPLDRLLSDQITSPPASTRNFGYDGNGNRTSDNSGIYTYASSSNRLSQTPLATITLDAAGNTLSDGTYTYSYNQDGHLAQVESGPNVLATYTYNHGRQRTRKVTNQGTTVYHYDIEGHLIVETRANGTLIKAYLWAEDHPIGQISAGVPETLVYLHADHLGTPRLATDATAAVVWSWEGAAFGATPPNPDPDGDTLDTVVNLRFAGQYYDEETGLLYNWHRYYYPRTGRYITSDPIGIGGGLNTYLYASANPSRFIDPFGLTGIETLYMREDALLVVAGRAFGGIAAYIEGLLTDDQVLANAALEGMIEGKQRNFEALVVLGTMGRGGMKICPPTKSLGANPFKGKTAQEISAMLTKKGYVPKGPDPVTGRGTFVNPVTGRGYHIDANHPLPKGPHVGVHRPRASRDALPPRDYPIGGP